MLGLRKLVFYLIVFMLLASFQLQAAKTYSLKNKADKIIEFSVTGMTSDSVYIEGKNNKEIEIPWNTLDLDWLEKNSKELIKAREYSVKLAKEKSKADDFLEELKQQKDPVAITGRVIAIFKNAVIIRARGIPPRGELTRSMTSRTTVANGLCYVENLPDISDIKSDQYYEIIAYENGIHNYKASFWEDNQEIKKYFARDDRRLSIFEKSRPNFMAIETYLERDTRHNLTKSLPEYIVERPPVVTGSGYMIKGGYVITAYHVVDGGKKITVNFKNEYYQSKVVAKNKGLDVAILKVEKINDGMPLYLSKNPRIGEGVFSLGYPNTSVQGLSIKYTSGDINALSGLRDDENFIQISVPLQPGNSGGPLFDLKGNFLGVVVSRLSDSYSLNLSGYVPQNVNYASKAKNLIDLLSQLKLEFLEPKTEKIDKADIIEKLQDYCVFIKSERG